MTRDIYTCLVPKALILVLLCLLLVATYVGSSDWVELYIALSVTAVAGCVAAGWQQVRILAHDSELLGLPLAIARDAEILDLYRSVGLSFRDLSANPDPIYRELALDRARQLSQEAKAVASGQIVFQGTEAWRQAYATLMRSRGLYRYRSVAYVHTPAYWQDEPGRQSMQVNFEMRAQGLQIERIVIVADGLWPATEQTPVEPIAAWLLEQARHGIDVRLVRASRLEADLLADFGLYGTRAIGRQDVDEQGRTVRFTLSFDFPDFLAAEARWDRLTVYAVSYEDLLDRYTTCT
jgi:hypothetical protein